MYLLLAEIYISTYSFKLLSLSLSLSFPSNLKDTLLHFLLSGLEVMSSLNFCLYENVIISPFFLKDYTSVYRILGWEFFSFSTLNISPHCFLASTVSHEKLNNNLTEDNLEVISCFSFAVFMILYLLLTVCL